LFEHDDSDAIVDTGPAQDFTLLIGLGWDGAAWSVREVDVHPAGS